MLWAKDDVGGVVLLPVFVKEAALALHLGEERRSGVGREDVEGRALDSVLLDPIHGLFEHVWPVVIEAKDEA